MKTNKKGDIDYDGKKENGCNGRIVKEGGEEHDIPQPQKGELQIKLEYMGVCGLDLHYKDEVIKMVIRF